MIRSVWTGITIVAVANFLATVGFVVLLFSSGRLDSARVEKIRGLLSETIDEETSRLQAEERDAQALAARRAQDARRSGTPESTEETLDAAQERASLRSAQLERLRAEVRTLRDELESQLGTLERDRAALDQERTRQSEVREQEKRERESEQFRRSVATLESQKAPAAYSVLRAMIEDGKRDTAVRYLVAMEDRARSRIVGEFIKADQGRPASEQFAAGLLESIRLHGLSDERAGDAQP
ncbi:MAG: hypothetical protein C0468_00240 [Planctomyces sp.]|nr:hypothetical protein [Planctomyces sp.]